MIVPAYREMDAQARADGDNKGAARLILFEERAGWRGCAKVNRILTAAG